MPLETITGEIQSQPLNNNFSFLDDNKLTKIVTNAKDNNLKGDGTTDDSTAFSDLLTTIGSSPSTILFTSGAYKLSSNITIPSNVTLWFLKGAMLSPDVGVTITINGSLESNVFQIFTGDGVVKGDIKVSHLYPQWWGAKGDGVSDDIDAIEKTIASVNASKGKLIKFIEGVYLVSRTIIINQNKIILEGNGVESIIQSSTDEDVIKVTGRRAYINIYKLKISRTNDPVNGNGIVYPDGFTSTISDVHIAKSKNAIVLGNNAAGTYINDVEIINCNLQGKEVGIFIDFAYDVRIRGGHISAYSDSGIKSVNGNNNAIHVHQTKILSNIPGQYSIYIGSGFYYNLSQVVVEQGAVANIYISNAKRVIIDQCWIGSGGSTVKGILANAVLGAVSRLIITGNRVGDCKEDGIYLADATDSLVNNNIIEGNSTSAINGYAGIHVLRGSNIELSNNRSYDPNATKKQGYGIRTASSLDFYIITNNTLNGNYTSGLRDDATGTNKVVTNNLL
jgi:parallel beta-helix repeat protein